jgi:3-oxoadipate enol-lactonase
MFVDAGTHRIFVDAAGDGDLGFVCLHGLADTHAVWRRLAPGLLRHGRVFLVDLRAHGESSAPPGPCRREDLAADVRAVLDHGGVERAVLVGHSLGGIVAMTAALACPEQVAGLILLGTASECSDKTARWYERLARASEDGGLEGLRREIYGPDAMKAIHGDPAGMAQVTRSLQSLHTDPLTPRLGSIRCPALLCAGDRDPMGAGASVIIQRRMPQARLEIIPGAGHWLHLEAVERLLPLIDGFVTENLSPEGGRQ